MKRKLSTFFVFLAFVFAGSGIAVLMYHQTHKLEEDLFKERFLRGTEAFIYTLQERYVRITTMLEGVKGLFESSVYVSEEEWNSYIENLSINKNLPGVEWVAFVKKIPKQEQSAFLANFEEENGKRIQIWPNTNLDFVFPIVYISPIYFQNLIGYDLVSSDIHFEALLESSNTGQPISTRSFDQNSDKGKQSDRIIAIPVEKDNLVIGWIAGKIDFSTIIEKVVAGVNLSDLDFEVYSGETTSLNNLIYTKKVFANSSNLLTQQSVFQFAGAKWTFVFNSDPKIATKVSSTTTTAFSLFLLVLILLFFALYMFVWLKKRKGYSNPEDALESTILSCTEYAFIATNTEGIITYFNPSAEQLLGYSAEEMIGKSTPESFHDKNEIEARAKELSEILERNVSPGFEVFVALADQSLTENRVWTYIRKDGSPISVQLSVTKLEEEGMESRGYLGVAIDVSRLKS